MTRFFVAIVFAAFAQVSVSDQAAISAYQSAIQRGSAENAFDALAPVAEALTRGRGNNPSMRSDFSPKKHTHETVAKQTEG